MRASDVHALSDPDLVEALRNARQDAFNLRFRHATGELENTAGMSTAKRELARALTVARQRGVEIHEHTTS